MRRKREWKTAAQIEAELMANPEWVRQQAERDAIHAARVAKIQEELRPEKVPLLRELAEVGCVIQSLDVLINTRETYPHAIDTLTRWLPKAKHPILREQLARCLTVPEARGAPAHVVLAELRSRKDPIDSQERWALANALTVLADKSMTATIESLLADPASADIRDRLEAALRRCRRQR
jgi:hypothetical protein